MRKTNDADILRLLGEGLNPKQIAEWYLREKNIKVSSIAIYKRKKRLAPPRNMPNFNQRTKKEQKFCIGIAEGKTQTQAAMGSFECSSLESAKVIGCQLMAKPEIEMSITELMDYVGIDKPYRIRRLKQIIDCPDLNIAHKGLDMSFRLDGSFIEKSINFNVNVDILPEEIENLSEIAREFAKQKISDLHQRDYEVSSNESSEKGDTDEQFKETEVSEKEGGLNGDSSNR